MNQDSVRVNRIHWVRVFPLLRLFDAASLGCGLNALLLAFACLVVSWTGSSLLNRMLSDGSITAVCEFPWPEYARAEGTLSTDLELRESWLTTKALPSTLGSLFVSATRVCFDGWFEGRTVSLLSSHHPVPSASWILSADLMVWNALVLCFFGTAIARTVATRFCCQTRTGLSSAVKLAGKSLRNSLLSTGLVLLFLAILRGLLFGAGVVAQWGSFGHWAVSLIWGLIVLTLVALFLMLVLGGIAWLLSLSAIGTDNCSGAEGLSRSISYVLSHRIWTACGIGIVTVVALLVRWLLELLVAVGANGLPISLRDAPTDILRRIWMLAIELIPHAAHLSVFLAGMTILYVLLRQKEDGIGTEEIDGAVLAVSGEERR